MDIDYSAGAERYRAEVRSFLASQLPADWQGFGALTEADRREFKGSWRKVLADNGLLAPAWPKEYGGGGLSHVEQVVLAEELAEAGVPDGFENDAIGIKQLGNTLIARGTEAQKKYFLPRMLSAEHVWCQGYSEPSAGSDLAGMRTRAKLEGDSWVIDGQKTWTSAGHLANWIYVLTRTNPGVPKHKGLTFFLVPMDQPGVEVRTITNAVGHQGFAEVFFTGAQASPDHVVGDVDGGWEIANTLLRFERGARVTTDAIRFGREIELLTELARSRGVLDDPYVRDELSWCHQRIWVLKARGFRALTHFLAGERPGSDAAIHKALASDFFQRYSAFAAQLCGDDILAPDGPGNGEALVTPEAGTPMSSRRWVEEMLYGRAVTIYGGSAQIQRNIVGEQLLGLPREPRLDQGPFRDIRPVSAR